MILLVILTHSLRTLDIILEIALLNIPQAEKSYSPSIKSLQYIISQIGIVLQVA